MPAAILSASVTVEARRRAASAGADEFLGKPFDAAALIQQIDRLAGRVSADTKSRRASARKRNQTPNLPSFGFPTGGAETKSRSYGTNLSAVTPEEGLVDQKRLMQLEDIARDRSFLAELINGFIADVDAILLKCQSPVANGDGQRLADLMHSLKGAAVGVGADRLSHLASELDRAALGQVPTSELKAGLDRIQRCFDSTSAQLKQYLNAHHEH
jgi:two-component system sensor histidine kinase RpfC